MFWLTNFENYDRIECIIFVGVIMDNLFKIRLNLKNNYSFGIFNSGFSLFDSLYIENLSDLAFSALKLQVISSPNMIFSSEQTIDYLVGGGYRFLSCDFINVDASYLASEKRVQDVCISVILRNQDDSLLCKQEFSCKILPYFFFSGFGDMAETAAVFVTPSQPELDRLKVEGSSSDPIDFVGQLYENIKDLRISFSLENYSGSVPLPVRLCERVIKERLGNSFELALLFASALERSGFSPLLAFSAKGKVYCGFSVLSESFPLISTQSGGYHCPDGVYFLDSSDLALGSSLSFETALFNAKNSLQLSDEKFTVLSIEKARSFHISPLPVRVSEKGSYILSQRNDDDLLHDFSDYDYLWKNFAEDPRVKSILLGGKFPMEGKKISVPFQPDLDVNQNKILTKILSNDFTLIRAQSGTGVSTLFSRATALKMKNRKNVLYITDSNYHPDDFSRISSGLFHSDFVWNVLKDPQLSCRKEDFKSTFNADESIFDDREKIQKAFDSLESYYSSLEGGKSIVSSFLMASDRYEQLRDANDTIIFSPEQVGALADDMVQNWFSTVNELIKSVAEIGTVHQNPLQLIRNKHFSYEFKSKLIRHLEDLLRALEQIISVRDQILPLFPSVQALSTVPSLNAYCDLFRLFSDFEKVPESFFAVPGEIETNFRQVTSLIQAKEENDNIYRTISVSFFDSVFELDAADLYTRYHSVIGDKGFKAMSQKHSILKTVKRYLKPNCDVENIEYILSLLNTYHRNKEEIEESEEDVFAMFSVSDTDREACWQKLSTSADLCYQCYAVYQSSFDLEKLPAFVSDFLRAKSVYEASDKVSVLKDLVTEFSSLKNVFDKLIFNEIDFYFPTSASDDYFSRLYQNLMEILSSSDHIKNWCNWLNVKEKAISIGLKSVVIAIENGKIGNEEIKRGFLRAFFKAVCEYNFISHPELIPENFSVEKTESVLVEALSAIDEKERNQLDSVLAMARFEGLREISGEIFSPSELICSKNVFSSVFPCVVSDLEEAKRLFSGKRHLFDLILFESKSQVSLNDLIWLFHCGKQVAFAGNFSENMILKTQNFDLTAPAFDYLWSVCDEKYSLSASYFSSPALSDFKNSFYANLRSDFRYYSIPCNRYSKVSEWRILPGSFGGEHPGANYYEAQNAVEELVNFAMSENKKSIGIIAATVEQKKLILRLFAQKLRHQEDVAAYFTDYSRFYISSVGEELHPCDYLIFSATFATDRSVPGSRLPDSFITFGGNNPFQAIGSVLSSAKEKLLVLSSFREEDLNATPSVLSAGFAFRSLFAVLRAPEVNNSYRVNGSAEEIGIIKRLRSDLESRGYQTYSGLQNGRYYIDLVVLDEESSFQLGIVSDHSVLNQRANIAAVECANFEFFKRHGWTLYRLRSVPCFDSYEHQLQNVLQILQHEETERTIF